jgi:hypothetical protein
MLAAGKSDELRIFCAAELVSGTWLLGYGDRVVGLVPVKGL